MDLVRSAAQFSDVTANRAMAAKLFAFLNYGQLGEVAECIRPCASMVAELLFAAAVGGNRPELLEYLVPILDFDEIHSVCAQFYNGVLAAFHRGQFGSPRTWIGDSSARAVAETTRLAEIHRADLLDYIRRTPGMVKTYHRMRVFARSKFLRPLEEAIDDRNVAAAVGGCDLG